MSPATFKLTATSMCFGVGTSTFSGDIDVHRFYFFKMVSALGHGDLDGLDDDDHETLF